MKVKDIGASATKWTNRAQAAAQDYVNGVNGAQQAEPAIAAVSTWQAAVQSPTAAKMFTTGLQKSGDAGWANGVKTKGATRYPQGVQGAAGKWQSGFSPYASTLASLNLPPRGVRRSAQNMARVQAVVQAMANVKTGSAS